MRFLLWTTLALAAGLAAVGAAAAPTQPRYGVSLSATIRNDVSYTHVTATEDCQNKKAGSGVGQLAVRTVRAGRSGGTAGTVRIRLDGRLLGGSFTEVRNCRFLPPEKLTGRCGPVTIAGKNVVLSFRRKGNRIVFRATGAPTVSARLCGLANDVLLGRLELAAGTVDARALRAGGAKVVARGTATRRLQGPAAHDPTVRLVQRVAVRWTLTFRRL